MSGSHSHLMRSGYKVHTLLALEIKYLLFEYAVSNAASVFMVPGTNKVTQVLCSDKCVHYKSLQ